MAKYAQETVNGTLLYVCIQQPTKKYESDETEWKVSLVVDKKTALLFVFAFSITLKFM